MQIKNYPHDTWTPEQVETLRRMFFENARFKTIAEELGMPIGRVNNKVQDMRRTGEHMPTRHYGSSRAGQRPIVAPPERLAEFSMPDNMRYEDDPAAIGPGRPVYMPIRNTHFQSGGSSLEGGRWLSTSGRQGAVT